MKTIEDKFSEWFKSYFEGFHTSNPDECVEVFKAGYELAQKEMEERLNEASEKCLEMANKYSVAVDNIVETRGKLKEAIELLEESEDLHNPYGSSEENEYKTKVYNFLKSQNEISK